MSGRPKATREALPPGRGRDGDLLGAAIDQLIEYLADEASIDRVDAHQAVREGRVVDIPAQQPSRSAQRLVLIAAVGFVLQAAVLGLAYYLMSQQ